MAPASILAGEEGRSLPLEATVRSYLGYPTLVTSPARARSPGSVTFSLTHQVVTEISPDVTAMAVIAPE